MCGCHNRAICHHALLKASALVDVGTHLNLQLGYKSCSERSCFALLFRAFFLFVPLLALDYAQMCSKVGIGALGS